MIRTERNLTFQISGEQLQKILNSAAIPAGMIATIGCATLIARNAMGHIDPRIANAIVLIPFAGSKVIQYFLPRTNSVAINVGASCGIIVPLVLGSSISSYATGSVVAALSAGLLTTYCCSGLTRGRNPNHSAANRMPN